MKGRGYWNPTPKMKALGFSIVRCGPDGAEAWKIATEWNERWQKVWRGDIPAPVDTSKLSRDQAEIVRRYPPRSVGAAFQAYIKTAEWEARAPSARNKVWWPAWYRIRDMWGDVDPNTIEFSAMSRWRAALEKKHGRGVAHKTLRVWRSLWTIMQGMKIAYGADPSRGVRNRAPAPRHQRWTEARLRDWSKALGGSVTMVWRASSRWLGTRSSLPWMHGRCENVTAPSWAAGLCSTDKLTVVQKPVVLQSEQYRDALNVWFRLISSSVLPSACRTPFCSACAPGRRIGKRRSPMTSQTCG